MDPPRDEMNNIVSSTSSTQQPPNTDQSVYDRYDLSENEVTRRRLQHRSHFKSTGNLTDFKDDYNTTLNNFKNIIHEDSKKDSLEVPIIGYEVMEERARFTVYKLKVENNVYHQSWLVFRRYTDFVRLYSRLKNELPTLVLPLPGKRWFKDNFDPAFLEERVRGLQVFVNDVIKKIPNHPLVREFFCLDEPPQILSYLPEILAVYGALEESDVVVKKRMMKTDAEIAANEREIEELRRLRENCPNCSRNRNNN